MANTTERQKAADRIRALMSKTTNRGCTEAEAIAAMNKVGDLLEQYNLTMDEVSLREQKCKHLTIPTGRKSANSMQWIIVTLGRFADCIVWQSRHSNSYRTKEVSYHFYGQEQDVAIAEYMYHLINNTMENETEAFKRSRDYADAAMERGGRRRASTSFQRGFIDRITSRLDEMKDEVVEREERRRRELATPGTDLVVLKEALVQQEFNEDKNTPNGLITRTASRSANNYDAYVQGKSAGSRMNLNGGVSSSSNNVAGYL
jgi:hypothetical protein